MADVTPGPIAPAGDAYPWSANARKLQLWFRAVMILSAIWIISLFLPLPRSAVGIAFLCLPVSLIASIFCVVYAYRVQRALHQMGYSTQDPWVIAVGAFVIGPLLTAIIAAMTLRSTLKKIARELNGEIAPTPLGR